MSDIVSKAKNGYLNDVLRLLKGGHSVDERDESNFSALYWSSCRGYPDICKVLIHYGSNVNLKYRCGFTSLHTAADRGHVDCVKVLIKAKADVNIKNDRGETALHLSCYRGFVDIVRILITANINPFIKNSNNKTALQEAHSQQFDNIADILVFYQQEIEEGPSYSKVPLKKVISEPAHRASSPYASTSRTNIDNILLTPYEIKESSCRNLRKTSSVQFNIPVTQEYDSSSLSSYSLGENHFSNSSFGSLESYSNFTDSCASSGFEQSTFSGDQSSEFSPSNVKVPKAMVRNKRQPEENPIQSPTIMEEHNKLSYDAVESFADVLQVEWAKGKERIQTLENENRNLKEECKLLATTNSNLGEDVNKVNQLLHEAREMRQQTIRRSHQNILELEKRIAEAEGNLNKSIPCQSAPHLDFKICHRNILELLKNTRGSVCDWNELCDKVSLLWQNCDNPDSLDEPNREWIEDCDYSIIGEQPINHFGDGCRDGSSSLVFRIQHKSKFYIVKMMINLINLQFVGHNEGHSIDQYLENNFGNEYLIPLYVSGHPNIVPVLHHYQGSTDRFQKFQKLLVPHNFDVPIEMASRTTFLILPEYPMSLKTFIMELKDNSVQSLYGLSELFLLQLLYQLLSSIVFLKTKNIVHRDIKADNVFLDNHLRPVLGDFGFARKLYNSQGKAVRFKEKSEVAAGNSHAWAPEICRYSRYDPQRLPQSVLLEDIYNKSDGYAVSRMFYSILQPPNTPDTFPTSSVNVPHYQNSQIPNLPDTLTAEFRSILRDLVLNDPIDRPTVKQAMFRVGCMLFSPIQEEVTSFKQLKQYHEARLLTLAAIDSQHWNARMSKEKISIEESTEINSIQIEAHFLTNISPQEFWEIHKTRTLVGLENGKL